MDLNGIQEKMIAEDWRRTQESQLSSYWKRLEERLFGAALYASSCNEADAFFLLSYIAGFHAEEVENDDRT